MASACVNPSSDHHHHSSSWLSPRISFSDPKPVKPVVDPISDPDFIDFEFHLHDPVAMLPADELFSGGKLVPLQLSKSVTDPDPKPANPPLKPTRREELTGSGSDFFAVSPKAPTCTSRWRELLRIKRQQQMNPKPDPVPKNPNPTRSSALKQFLHRRSALSDPTRTELEPLSRLSLSSSTSSESRLSVDSDPKCNPRPVTRNPRPARRSSASAPPPRCASVDSPRMNASGRVIFQGLGRSSSSPSTLTSGPHRNKYKAMERSYSANVRVINVPVPVKAGAVFGFLGSKNVSSTNGCKGKN